MDDKDQTQLHPSDSSAGKTRSRSRRQPPAGQPMPDGQVIPPSQMTGSLANQEQDPQTTGSLASQTPLSQEAKPPQPQQSHPTRQLMKPQPPLPQPILFAGGEDDILFEEQIILPLVPRQRLRRTRRWLRSRTGRVVIPVLALLIGLAVGLTSIIWYGLSGEGPLVIVAPAAQGNLIVDANQAFVSQLVSDNLLQAGLPGHVQNITVELEHGDQIIIQGDDTYSALFLSLTKHFTIDVQPYVQSCVLQVRITHADLSGIPVTTFVTSFQGQINQQLAEKPAGLPSGFTYCTVGVSTEPGGMYITYKAVPVTK